MSFVHAYAPITLQMMTDAGLPENRVEEEADHEFRATCSEVARFIQGWGLDELHYSARIVEGLGAAAIAGVVDRTEPDLLVINILVMPPKA